MSQLGKPRMVSYYKYNQPIEVIWRVVKDTSLLNNILSTLKQNFAGEPVLLNCNTTYEKNASFFFYINKQYKLLYKVLEVVETDYFCKISCKIVSSINKDQSLSKSVYLHSFGHNSTYLVYERSCHLTDVPDDEREKIKRTEERTTLNFLSHIEYSIENRFYLRTQWEGRRFKVNVNTLIKELNNFLKNSFLSSNGFECSQLPIMPGVSIISHVKNKLFPQKQFRLLITIDYIQCNSRGQSAKVSIQDKGNSRVERDEVVFPNRFVISEIIMINHEETYYSMRHFFYESVSEKVLEFVSLNKVNFLKKLTKVLGKKPSQ